MLRLWWQSGHSCKLIHCCPVAAAVTAAVVATAAVAATAARATAAVTATAAPATAACATAAVTATAAPATAATNKDLFHKTNLGMIDIAQEPSGCTRSLFVLKPSKIIVIVGSGG